MHVILKELIMHVFLRSMRCLKRKREKKFKMVEEKKKEYKMFELKEKKYMVWGSGY